MYRYDIMVGSCKSSCACQLIIINENDDDDDDDDDDELKKKIVGKT